MLRDVYGDRLTDPDAAPVAEPEPVTREVAHPNPYRAEPAEDLSPWEFTRADEVAEDLVVQRLAVETAARGSWEAARTLFAPNTPCAGLYATQTPASAPPVSRYPRTLTDPLSPSRNPTRKGDQPMTTTTDRLVASPKTEPTSGNCWVLVDDKGREYDDGDYVVHFTSEAKARAQGEELAGEGLKPHQLDAPCRVLACSCCSTILDEDGEGHRVHCQTLEEVEDSISAYEWERSADGTLKCPPCATGECEECADEVARG